MSLGLAIVGYGKMGRLIEQLAPEYGFDVCARFSEHESEHAQSLSLGTLRSADVAVEFTGPHAAPDNLRRLAALGVPTVCGTTGWYKQLPVVCEAVLTGGAALVYSANFSVGINVFLQTVAHAASFFAKYPEYEAWGWEIHHSAKRDAPSGTLKKLAEEIRASGYAGALTLTANRAGAHPGTHEIGFDSGADTITLRHTARNREGFARGALRAARWIAGKKGVFEFREILNELS
ncbi:MAG TPA: dihydrodipicolinate reductase C-terminal domain-containing protein [Candidatus Angelobacter sp.]|nr:dihydrodipicolinate reductase C-terminal domain-containing protein [Candidatus Angelobacter sp.]